MKKLPLFIVFEGIDGSGKSTLAGKLFDYCVEKNLEAIKTAEPTCGIWGRKIRDMLKSSTLPDAAEQLKLFILDREEDVKQNISPALKQRKIIIMDRYYYSNAAYQGAQGIPVDEIILKNRRKQFPEPDRVYLIDIHPDLALARIKKRNNNGEEEFFEKKQFLSKVREIYISISNDKFLILDGALPLNELYKTIINDIEKNFA